MPKSRKKNDNDNILEELGFYPRETSKLRRRKMQKNEGIGTPHSMYRDVSNSLVSYTAKDDGTLSAIFSFNGALDIFAGHFPGNPMLPGVLQLEMIRLMMKKKYAAGLRIDYIQKVKFLEPIFPDESIKVHIKSDRKDKPLFIDCTLIVKEKNRGKAKNLSY